MENEKIEKINNNRREKIISILRQFKSIENCYGYNEVKRIADEILALDKEDKLYPVSDCCNAPVFSRDNPHRYICNACKIICAIKYLSNPQGEKSKKNICDKCIKDCKDKYFDKVYSCSDYQPKDNPALEKIEKLDYSILTDYVFEDTEIIINHIIALTKKQNELINVVNDLQERVR